MGRRRHRETRQSCPRVHDLQPGRQDGGQPDGDSGLEHLKRAAAAWSAARIAIKEDVEILAEAVSGTSRNRPLIRNGPRIVFARSPWPAPRRSLEPDGRSKAGQAEAAPFHRASSDLRSLLCCPVVAVPGARARNRSLSCIRAPTRYRPRSAKGSTVSPPRWSLRRAVTISGTPRKFAAWRKVDPGGEIVIGEAALNLLLVGFCECRRFSRMDVSKKSPKIARPRRYRSRRMEGSETSHRNGGGDRGRTAVSVGLGKLSLSAPIPPPEQIEHHRQDRPHREVLRKKREDAGYRYLSKSGPSCDCRVRPRPTWRVSLAIGSPVR